MVSPKELVGLAGDMRQRAYVPYSHYQVGAALLCADGSVYTGCNIENAAYGPSICAERAAVCRAVCDGHTDFVSLAVISSGDAVCFPCGVCRQTLYEFNPELKLFCSNSAGDFEEYTLAQLLPHAFGPKDLET